MPPENINTENKSDQIDIIINEISECREDERNMHSQIVQVIATAGSLLTLIFGASFFTSMSVR